MQLGDAVTRWLDPAPVRIPGFLRDEHPMMAATLVRRGFDTPERVRAFLDPGSYAPAPPSELPGMTAAAERVWRAVQAGDPICVWGDFDVDGQSSTSLLVSALRSLGAEVRYHIPVRARHSHGIHLDALQEVLDAGARLILTCDTGIGAHKAVAYARSRNVDMVITDHHDLPAQLPDAAAVTDPKMLPADHPLAGLPGVGVAYKLAEALYALANRAGEEHALLDLAALGIVADLALLTGDTRYLLQRGLRQLRECRRPGLQILCELIGVDPARLDESQISFQIAPRLNALGRLDDANQAVELLTGDDPIRLKVIAQQIEGLNAQRRLLTDQVQGAAEAMLRQEPSLLTGPVIVLAHPSWPGGVIGLVAGRLAERYRKPALVLTAPPDSPARGSARSVDGVHITQAIATTSDLLLGFGGHPMAAGLSLDADKLPEFRRRLARAVEAQAGAAPEEAELAIDAWVALADLNFELAAQIECLSPFGPGNPALTLACRDLRLDGAAQTMGRGAEHLKMRVADDGGTVRETLWWNGADDPRREALTEGARFDLALSLRAGEFRGQPQLRLELADVRVVTPAPVEVRAPKRKVVDLCKEMEPLKKLPAGTPVWAEGETRTAVNGLARHELVRAEGLAVFTTPPGPGELREALKAVKPKTVYLILQSPAEEDAPAFLKRLAGLAKYALNRQDGRATVAALAAATAQRELTVRIGLEWLTARGHLTAAVEGDEVRLSAGAEAANPLAVDELETGLRALLTETTAYRAHLQHTDAENLLPD